MTKEHLNLLCLVDGDPSSKAFIIPMLSTETCSQLRSTIHSSKPVWFRDLEAEDLTLWRVSIPIDDDDNDDEHPILLSEVSVKMKLKGTHKLNPALKLKQENTDSDAIILPENTIHIIVRRTSHASGSRPGTPVSSARWQELVLESTDKVLSSKNYAVLVQFFKRKTKIPVTEGALEGLPWILPRAERKSSPPSLLFLNLPESTDEQDPPSTADYALRELRGRVTPLLQLFGVSGCGKTRTAIEMLSKNWGFYFNGSLSDWGSDDLILLLGKVKEGNRYKTQDSESNTHVHILALALVLSRVIILQVCLDIAEREGTTFTCKDWMLLQLNFNALFPIDLFALLFGSLAQVITQYSVDFTVMSDFVKKRFSELRKRLLDLTPNTTSEPSVYRILLVIDEAQNLSKKEFGTYLSEQINSELVQTRPILSPLVHGFYGIVDNRRDFCVVPCGTGLSIYDMNWLQDSAPGIKGYLAESPPFTNFQGWESVEQVQTYRELVRRSLCSDKARVVFDSVVPDASVPELFTRLHGRFRPIVSAISRIIAKGNPDDWQEALDDTEARLVSYDHRGEQDNLCNEIVRLENKYRENLSIFKEPRTVEEVLGLLLFQRYMFGADKLVLQEAVPELVEHALGRIKIVDGVTRTVLDEPFVLKAVENYFKMRDSGFMKTLEYWVLQSDKAQAHGYAWELMMMNVLAETFKTRPLSDWPHEPSISSQCAALDGHAVIVGLDEEGLQRGISYEHISMEEFMDAHVNTDSLQQGQPVPPFFFPRAKPSGPDIVFYIRVKDKLFPVFVQLKLRQILTTKDAKAATVSAPTIEAHVKDLGRFCPTDNTYISMIFAYPATVVAKLRPRPVPGYNLRPQPEIKDKCLAQVTVIIDNNNISEIFPQSHVDFLDGIKDPMKRQAVDTLEAVILKKTRM